MKRIDAVSDGSLESVAGGNDTAVQNPLLGMLDVYYQIAMSETSPAAKAEAVRVYNRTLEQMMRDGVNCTGYRYIQM
jgi:ABC-type amino acid transport substrate-binding protein